MPIQVGDCISLALRKGLYGGCRVIHRYPKGPVIEVVHWFGTAPPTAYAIERANVLASVRPFVKGWKTLYQIDGAKNLPPRAKLVGRLAKPRPTRAREYPQVNTWADVLDLTLEDWAILHRKDVVKVTADAEADDLAERAKERGLTKADLALEEEIEDIVAMWRDGEYEYPLEAIQNVRLLLPRAHKRLPKLGAKLERVLAQAIRALEKWAKEGGEPAADLKRVLASERARRANKGSPGSRARTRRARR